MDRDQNGSISFDEFSEWAVANTVLVSHDDDSATSAQGSHSDAGGEQSQPPSLPRVSGAQAPSAADYGVSDLTLRKAMSGEQASKAVFLFKSAEGAGRGSAGGAQPLPSTEANLKAALGGNSRAGASSSRRADRSGHGDAQPVLVVWCTGWTLLGTWGSLWMCVCIVRLGLEASGLTGICHGLRQVG
jgi:hypothetical protein